MRSRICPAPWALAAALFAALPNYANSAEAASDEDRFQRLERLITEMDARHRADLKARDEEIARLRAEVSQSRAAARAPADEVERDEVERTRREVLEDIDRRDSSPLTLRPRADDNPRIAVVVDSVASFSPDRENDAYNRFDVREAELDLRAAVDPRADGVLVLAFERDVENLIFAEAGEEEEGGGPESSVNVEDAYLFLHDFGVPNLTAKLGRFHLRFGRQNLLHLHDLPTTDPPFVNQAFLSPEALTDAGVSFSYVLPSRLTGGQYVELIAEVISGEGAGSESPTLAGDLSVDSPAFNGHVLWNTDLGPNLNFELGGSWLTGHADADNARDVNLFGADATLVFTNPSGGSRNALLQAEAIYGLVDDEAGDRQEAFGAYLLAQQQLSRDWYAGTRLDWTENPLDDSEEAWGVTPYVSWYWSEFLRFRGSYQHRGGDRPDEDVFSLQATWIFGAHPPHPYWSMR